MSAQKQIVSTSVNRGVMTVTLDDPDHLNRFSVEMFEQFGAAIDKGKDKNVRAVVVRGSGRVFCAGFDINMWPVMNNFGLHSPQTRDFLRMCQEVFVEKIESLEKPVIAAIHNVCFGGGFEISMACDIRIVTADVRMACPEVKLGVIPEAGGCHRLARLVGLGRTKELIMTGREIHAEEAERIGLVSRVVPTKDDLDAAVQEYLDMFELCGPVAVGLAKKTIDSAFGLTSKAGLELEYLVGNALYATPEAAEGYNAFREKRKPNYYPHIR